MFKPNWAPWSAPLYAAIKGIFLGAVAFSFELTNPGIATSAVLLTTGTAGSLLALYRARIISVTDRMRQIITTALVGVMVSYLGVFLLGLCGVRFGLMTSGPVGIGLSCITTAVAAAVRLLAVHCSFPCVRIPCTVGGRMSWAGSTSAGKVELPWLNTPYNEGI